MHEYSGLGKAKVSIREIVLQNFRYPASVASSNRFGPHFELVGYGGYGRLE